MFEAIASRTPIVCSDHPMFRPIIVDRRNASVFSAGDYRSLATAILRTLSDSDLYAQLSNNATLTWEALKGPADWRTMILKWTSEGPSSPWIQDRLLPQSNSGSAILFSSLNYQYDIAYRSGLINRTG